MIDRRSAAPLPRPAPAPDARTARRPVLRPRRDALRAARPRQPGARAPRSASTHDDDLLGDGSREAVLAELDAERDAPGRGRGDRPGRPVADGSLRARARAPQRPPRDLRHRRPATLGAALVRARHRRRRPVPAVRPRPRPARPSDSTPSPAGSRRSPPTSRRPRPGRPSRRSGAGSRSRSRPPPSCRSFFDELVAAGVGALPAAEQRRLERAERSRPRSPSTCTRRGSRARSPSGTDDWAIGRERHDAMVGLRAFDGLDARRDPGARLGAARPRSTRHAPRPPARSTPTPTRRPSSTGSSPTSRPTSTLRSRPTARRCSARAATSSSTTS